MKKKCIIRHFFDNDYKFITIKYRKKPLQFFIEKTIIHFLILKCKSYTWGKYTVSL